MSAPAVEQLLAQLYTDAAIRRRFIANPREVARLGGLDAAEAQAMAAIDLADLRLAARSYAHKRAGRSRGKGLLAWMTRRLAPRQVPEL